MKFNLLLSLFLLMTVACQKFTGGKLPEDKENLKIAVPASDSDLSTADLENMVPGEFFSAYYGYEKYDYVVFPHRGDIGLNPLSLSLSMIPAEFDTDDWHFALAPERRFGLRILCQDKSGIKSSNERLSFSVRNVPATIYFNSSYCDMLDQNEQNAKISIKGSMDAVGAEDDIIHYIGDLNISVEMPDKKHFSLAIKELYRYR